MRADLCIVCCVFRHTAQADGDSCYAKPLSGNAEMIYSPMCEHPGRILADSVSSLEADLGREDCLNTEAASCFQMRTAKCTEL